MGRNYELTTACKLQLLLTTACLAPQAQPGLINRAANGLTDCLPCPATLFALTGPATRRAARYLLSRPLCPLMLEAGADRGAGAAPRCPLLGLRALCPLTPWA